jgi:hypothetical protein
VAQPDSGADNWAPPVGLSPAPTAQPSAICARAPSAGAARQPPLPSYDLWHVGPAAQGVTYLAKRARPGRVCWGSWPAVDQALTIYDPSPRASPSPQPTTPPPEKSWSSVEENSSLRERGVSRRRRTWVCATGRAPPRAPNYLKSLPE